MTTAPVAPAAAPAPTPEETAPAAEPTTAPEASASEPAAASTAAAAGAASARAGLKKDKAEKEGTAPRRPVTRARWYYIAADERNMGPTGLGRCVIGLPRSTFLPISWWPRRSLEKYSEGRLCFHRQHISQRPSRDGLVAASGIALYPPAPQQTRIFDVEEEEQEPTSRQWNLSGWRRSSRTNELATGFVGGGQS